MSAQIVTSYDSMADTLYLRIGEARPCITEEGPRGLLFRRSIGTHRPCAVTVMGYDEEWRDSRGELSRRIGHFLDLPPSEVYAALEDSHAE